MGLVGSNATFARKARSSLHHLLALVLAASTLSAISIISPPAAKAATVTATGTNPAACNQEVGNSTNVVSSRVGNTCVVEFKNVGTTTWQAPTGISSLRVMVVAGGGSGGGLDWTGGGGAGGVITASAYAVTAGSNYSVVVGAGGQSQTAGNTPGNDGGNSSFDGKIARGGGGGAGYGWNNSYTSTGRDGGSGGGSAEDGSGSAPPTIPTGGATTQDIPAGFNAKYGFKGGDSGNLNGQQAGGGGGGAGGAGGNVASNSSPSNRQPGNGGDGVSLTLGGKVFKVAAGGGGASHGTKGVGGSAGGDKIGGDGARSDDVAGNRTSPGQGTANTGSGGGGTMASVSASSGAGGSGIVVVAYDFQPSAPTITGITGGDNSLSVAFTAPTNGANITGYKYSTNGGSTWSASTGNTSSPISIPSLTTGTSYAVQIRAVNDSADGVATASTNAKAGSFCSQTTNPSPPAGYTVITFTSTTSCNWSVPAGVSAADVLIVGGGGAGGGGIGGGGGAGEFVETTRTGLTGGSSVLISVGAGGTSNNNWNAGNAGGQSRFDSVIAYGGGGGGTNSTNLPVASGGPNFGSQGGGGYDHAALAVGSRSDGITGYRNNGGSGSLGASGSATGGGGGGAGGAGGAGTTSSGSPAQSGGAGGAGRSSSITGTATFYAAGGGGGVNGAPDTANGSAGASSGNPGAGGSSIGGSGGAKANAANPGNYGNRGDGTGGTVNSNGSAGVANTGSGGGGASNWVSGGAGGSGVVIVKYVNAPSIALSTSTISATAGTAITNLTVTNTGGPANFTISPSLPSSLSINSSTGVVSGTPSGPTSSTTYTITATNTSGTTTAQFTYSAIDAACSSPVSAPSSGYTYVAFKNIGACSWTPPAGASTIDILVVGGGGGGASRHAGGGGAGGLINATGVAINGSVLTITVGAGGAGGPAQGTGGANASNGGSSAVSGSGITARTAVGGGAGGYGDSAGASGGSGGGGGSSGAGGSGTALQGNNGSSGATSNPSYWVGGGGGGAGGAGTTSSSVKAGSGGPGLEISWIPTAVGSTLGVGTTGTAGRTFAGGGGGGTDRSGIAGGNGGAGGGAAGSTNTATPSAGTANTGGGGGGSGISGTGTGSFKGGDGGSGVVVIRYANPTRTITYALNSGTGTAPTQAAVSDGATFVVASGTGFSRDGFTFSGWNDGSTNVSAGSTYTVGASPVTLTAQWSSNVATLSSLLLSTGTLSSTFASGTTSYTTSVPNATSSITVTPTVTQANATIQVKVGAGSYASVTSASASGSLALAVGSNTITVLVTAQDGTTTTTYTVTVTRAAAAVAPTIGTHPSNFARKVGESVTFSVAATASDSGTLSYQWQKGGVDISLATSASYTFTPASTSDAGDYRVIVTNTLNSTTATSTSNVGKLVIAGTNSYRNFARNTYTDVLSNGNSFKSSSAVIPATGSFTIEGWFRESVTLDNQNPIFAQGTVNNPGFGAMVHTSPSRKFLFFDGNYSISPTTVITAGKWYHFALSYDRTATTMKLYLNGTEVGSISSYTPTLSGEFFLGNNNYYSSHFFHGQQDQFKIWTSALTSTEVATSMHSYGEGGITGKTLRTLYDFNQTTGNTMVDKFGGFDLSANGSGTSSSWASSALNVTFDEQGGSPAATDTTFDFYTQIADPGTPTKTGYTFSGWSRTSNGSAISFPYIFTPLEAVTVYAVWTANSNTVTFNANDGSGTPATSTQTITSGAATALTANAFTRTGYTFAGWDAAADGSGTDYTNQQSVTITSGMTLFAKWTINSYAFAYAGNTSTGGTTPAGGGSKNYASTITVAANSFTKTGYAFASWNTAADGSGTTYAGTGSVTFTMPDAAVTLYAQWTALSTDATLSALTLTTATLSPDFASGTTSYTASVANATTSITVTPTRNQANATITVNGTAVTSGSASGSISLNVGSNTITVIGTAQDGTTTATYTVTVTRAVGAASKVAITRASVGTQRGVAFTTQPQITVQDSGSNTVTSSSAVVTATVAGGTLVGTTTATASSGVATFTDLGVDGINGRSYTIIYTVSGLTVATATVTLTGTTCDGSFTCQEGDTGPGGGTIFYVAPSFFTQVGATGSMCTTNCKYLEAAPNTWSGGSADPARSWSTNANSNQTTAVTGADGTAIGTGFKNSLDIVAQIGNVAASSAAVAARGYTRTVSGTTYTDWYLSSRDELNQMCKWARGQSWISDATLCNSSGTLAAGFRADFYWSSSEVNATLAWNRRFDVGSENDGSKAAAIYVRPIRAFGPAPTVISVAAIAGVAAPVAGATPVTTTTAGTGYTGTVSWLSSEGVPPSGNFASGTIYAARITLTPTSGYTLTGVNANFFTVTGATSVSNDANSGAITAVFPATASSNVATLSALVLSSGTLSPDFVFGTTSYTASVVNATTSITVTPTRTQANATITVNGTAVTSGSASGSISLNVGSNTITVIGTAQDGTTTATYTVTVTRAVGAALTPAFGSTTATADGFTVQISNYSSDYTWGGSATASGSVAISDSGLVTVTGVAPGTSATATITTTRTGYTGGSATVSATSISCADGGLCIVGNTGPGGGIVFYVAPSGGTFACGQSLSSTCKYLEAAPITGASAWTDNRYAWSGNINTAIGTTSTEIGTGYSNTLKMVRQSGAGTAGAGSAARNYRGGGLNDWYLPSKDELNQLYINRTVASASDGYWSSSEYNTTGAWDQGFGNGSQGVADPGKQQTTPVRPIRAFGSSAVESAIIYVPAIAGVTAPVRDATPVTTVTAANGYTGTVTWSSSPSTFAAATTYTATITLTAASGFTLTGVTANFFTVTGATSVTHLANSGSITAEFPATEASPALTPTFGSTTATADGFTVQISNYSSDYTWGGSATASGSVAISDSGLVTVTGVASGTSATATITTTRTSYTDGSATVSATSISSNVATLSALTLTTATLSPTFASGTTSYTASVVNATTSITVTPTRTQANATITVNGTAVTSGSASGAISLNVGANTITVVVTAQDGTTTATYTVTVTRAEATYTITLAAGTNGTGSNQTLTKTNGTSLTLPDSASANGYFTRAGYTVSGWSTSNGGSQTHALGGSFTTEAATTLYPVWTAVSCSPTSSTAFGYTIYKFTTTGTCFWTVPDGITNVDVLVVAGGGGGGYSWGNTGAGGGGGGQVKTGTATLSSPLEVTVGAGGSAGTLSSGRGGSGVNSSAASITALGGTGGCGLAAPTCSVASMATASAAANGGAGAASPGNGTRGRGGGGSSTTVSLSGSETGGVGTGSSYSGTSINYGVGGNGGSPTGSSANSVGSTGSVNTGNGGGGASTNSASNGNSALGANGGAGGSGVVIVRYGNTLTITYNANGGTTASGGSTTTITGGTVSSLATTSRTGYTFNGWFNQASGGIQITTSAGHNYYGNFTLYAQWTANSLTITYDSQNGSAISNGSTTTGGSISVSPGTPTRAGYTFNGWSTTDTGTAVTFPHTHGQTANFTLFAVWNANSLTVTYDSQGGSAVTAGSSQTGASISAAPTAPTRTGYTFTGWSTTSTGSVVTFPYAHGQTANFTLYAIWSANALTVTYDSQGGSAVTSGGSQTGASISAAPTAPTRAGYTFGGWSVTDGGTAVTFPYAHGQTADFTLFAKWSANALTITYNSQGGSAVTSGSVNTAASISSAPTAPTRAGYTFAGWSATDTGTAVTFPYAHGQTADFTLFGKWSANALTITYNSQGGSAVSAGSVNTGASISAAPTAPTRAGYTFGGWSATDTGTAVTFPHAHGQTADFTLFAKWSANALTITYDSKSGSAVSNGTVNTGASILTAPTAPTRTGYTFAGWSATDTGTAVTFPHAHGQTADFTMFAKWTGNTNTITYDSKGGAAVADGSFVTGGSIAAAPTEPIRAGYTLVGWSLTDGGSVISYPYSPPGTSGITLYAIWTGISCSPTSTTTGGYTIYTFATAGTCFWSVPVGATDVEILAVAGGGGGGYAWDNAGAGGGAGGQVNTGTATLGSILEVTVGAGGTAGTVSSTRGGSGGNSSALTVIALGGTGGCAARAITCSNSAQATSLAAANGGVGGIGGASGKGGGGSNTAGTLTTTTAGGAGTASNYSGTSATYGVGGTGGTARGLATSTNIAGAAGSANTGNGGGGASAKSSSGEVNGGTGGTGLVVVRIASALTITYDSQSGSAVSNGSTFTGASIATAPTEPTRSNYTFLGWFTATTGGSAISFPYVHGQTANFTLYAKWTLNTYSIVFNANSGLGLMGNQTITHGVATNLNANLYSRANYVFYRWATAADGTGTTYNNLAEITLTAGTTLYAQWTANTYVVTFNYNGGNGGDSTATASFTTAGSPIMLPVPTKTGFTFAGWHSDAALATQIGTGVGNRSYSPTGGALSLNAYAKWEAVNYTFTYNSNSADSGSVPTESSKQITQTATVKANTGNLVRVGYTFSGWNIASDGTGTNYLSGSLFTVGSDDVILFAKWSPNTYTVTYNTNGGTGNAQRSSANVTSDTYTTDSSPVVFPGVGTLTRSGYTFGGWNTSAAGTGTNYVATNTYTTVSNVIFYAKWNPVTYTITYNGNQNTGGTTPTAGGYTTGQDSPYAVLSNSFTKTLNVFGGWNTADNGTGTSYSPGASITTLVDIVLYAVWIPQFTLHYAINGGSVTSGSLPGDQLYNTGTLVGPLFSAVSRTGYTFGGWVNGSTTIVPNGNFTILADSVLTAKWTPINYTISYNSDGGSEAPETSTRQIGQSFTVGAAVSKPGYNFTGWTTDNTVVGADAVVVMGSANIAYTALWVAKVYTVSYDWNGGRGTAVEDVNYTFGTTAITLPLVGDRIKDGFTFAGWSETSTGSLLSATYIPSRTRTLIARWTVGNFTITYNLSGGTLANASVAVQNGSPTVLPLPTRTNFVFDGWHSATTGGSRLGVNGDSFTPIASQTVYARWIQSSLYGISNSLTRIGSVVTVANIANTFSGANSNSSVSVSVPENALPAGTTINFDLVGNSSRATGLLPNVSYLISIAISWITADGLVPDTVPGKPISVTISNETIKIGATAYAIVNNASTLLGTATQDRTITIALTSDPEVVIAAVKPSAPLNVTATSNGHQQSVISWSAPSTNGGSDINGYTVTSNTSATCTTTTTSCTISGLAHGTAYTFTVTATNNVGTSDASTSASATTAALYTVAFNAKGGTPVANGSFLTASTISEPTAPTRAGYSFAGWSATDGGSAIGFPYAPGVTSNITLFARWDALDNAVTFDSRGGSPVSSSVFSSGGTVAEPTAPTRAGFTFAGWAATDTGTAVTFPHAPGVVTDITLYAKWTEIVQNNSGGSSAPAPVTPSVPAPVVPVKSNVTVVAPITVTGDKDAKVNAVEIAVLPSGSTAKPPTIKIDKASEKFIAEFKVVDGKLVLTPETGFSGKRTVTVTITENSIERIVQIPLIVLPEVVTKPIFTPTAWNRTTVSWTESPNADSVTVYLNGKKVCATSASSCSVSQVLGPRAVIEIVSNGGDRTVSKEVEADFRQNNPVAITRLVSSTIRQAILTTVDTKALDKVIALIKTQGFGTIQISEISPTKKTAPLAAARINAIKKYINDKTGSRKITFEVVPAGSRTLLTSIFVKA